MNTDEEDSRRSDKECVFCSIASGDTEAEVAHESEETIFFHDISPKAAVHIVGIPKEHYKSFNELVEQNIELSAQLLKDIKVVADKLGLTEGGYRVITNVGGNAGQEVSHLHWHILGGESLGPLKC